MPRPTAALLQRRDLVLAAVAVFGFLPLLLGWLGIWPAKTVSLPPLPGPLQFQTDINQAPLSEITLLPDIGPQLGQRIVDDRQQNGPFRSLDDLQRVPGIGPKRLQQLAPMLIFPDQARPDQDTAAASAASDPAAAEPADF